MCMEPSPFLRTIAPATTISRLELLEERPGVFPGNSRDSLASRPVIRSCRLFLNEGQKDQSSRAVTIQRTRLYTPSSTVPTAIRSIYIGAVDFSLVRSASFRTCQRPPGNAFMLMRKSAPAAASGAAAAAAAATGGAGQMEIEERGGVAQVYLPDKCSAHFGELSTRTDQ